MSGISMPWGSGFGSEEPNRETRDDDDMELSSSSLTSTPRRHSGTTPTSQPQLVPRVYRRKFPGEIKGGHWRDLVDLMLNLECYNFSELRTRYEQHAERADQTAHLQKKYDRLKESYFEIERQLDTRIKRDQQQTSNLRVRYDALEGVNQDLKSQIARYQKELNDVEQDRRKLQTEKNTIKMSYEMSKLSKQNTSVKKLRAEKDALQQEVTRLLSEVDRQVGIVSMQKREATLSQTRIDDLVLEVEWAKCQKNDAFRKKNSVTVYAQTDPSSTNYPTIDIANLQQQNDTLTLQNELITQQYKKVSDEKTVCQSTAQNVLKHTVQMSRRQLEDMHAELQNERVTREQCQNELQLCQARLQAKKDEILFLEKYVSDSKSSTVRRLVGDKLPRLKTPSGEDLIRYGSLPEAPPLAEQEHYNLCPPIASSEKSKISLFPRRASPPKTAVVAPKKKAKIQVVEPVKKYEHHDSERRSPKSAWARLHDK